MISILIPTYNYDVFPLVENLYRQCMVVNAPFEILVFDDASDNKETVKANLKINTLSNCSFEVLPTNLGRSKIRNRLANHSKYEWLLYLDADTLPSNPNFIATYLDAMTNANQVIYGGVSYPPTVPNNQTLRYEYGVARESLGLEDRLKSPYRSFISMGFAIKKSIFNTILFNENLQGYGYEDSVFANELKKKKVSLIHIDNPVVHLNMETTSDFIKKSELALKNLIDFHNQGFLDEKMVRILRVYLKIKKAGMGFLVRIGFKFSKNAILKNLHSTNPSLFLFDIYRLGYLSSIK